MINPDNIFMKRFVRAQGTNIKYLRLLFNDHFIIFLLIAFGGAILGYRQLLVSPQFEVMWHSQWWQLVDILWLVLGLQMGTLVTYFKPADRFYFMAIDQKIAQKYLSKSIIVSTVYGFLWQVAFAALLIPILWQTQTFAVWRFIILMSFMISYKWLLLLLTREQLFLVPRFRFLVRQTRVERLFFNFVIPAIIIILLFHLPEFFTWLIIAVWFVFALLVGYFSRINRVRSQMLAIDWLRAIPQSLAHEQHILHFYATFAEVPKQSRTIKRRRYFDFIITGLTKHQPVLYRLYLIRLVRDTEILPLLVRLILVGSVVIYALQGIPMYMLASIAALIIYLIIFQMLPIYSTTRQVLWTRIVPQDEKVKQLAFRKLIKQVILVTILMLTISSIVHGWLAVISVLAMTVVVGIVLDSVYVPQKLK